MPGLQPADEYDNLPKVQIRTSLNLSQLGTEPTHIDVKSARLKRLKLQLPVLNYAHLSSRNTKFDELNQSSSFFNRRLIRDPSNN